MTPPCIILRELQRVNKVEFFICEKFVTILVSRKILKHTQIPNVKLNANRSVLKS